MITSIELYNDKILLPHYDIEIIYLLFYYINKYYPTALA